MRPKSNGGPPRYQAIMRQLLEEIRSGTPPVGSRLPTEADLGARFGAGRHTIRDAVRGLVDLGVVDRHPRIGTTVIASEPVRRYELVPSTSDGVVSNMLATWIAVPRGTPVVADESLASRLGCEVGARWYRYSGIRVLREGDQGPVCFSDEYVRDTARARRSMAEPVRTIPTESAIEQEIRAELFDDDAAKALDEPLGAPALVVVRRYWDLEGMLVAVMRHSHPATRFSIRMSLPTT